MAPVLPQIVRQRHHGHAVDARTTLVGLHLPQSILQVFSLTYCLHQSVGSSWAFGSTCLAVENGTTTALAVRCEIDLLDPENRVVAHGVTSAKAEPAPRTIPVTLD